MGINRQIPEKNLKFSVAATVAANALTATITKDKIDFRSATIASGVNVNRSMTGDASVVVPSGATLGTIAAQASRLVLLAIDNAGTVEAAIINLAGGVALDEAGLISTTAISAAANASNVAYSTAARANVAYRVVGVIDITEAVAGTWATAPSAVNACGGEVISALSSIGYGQTWQNVTGSRALGTTYYNLTGKPIVVSAQVIIGVNSNYVFIQVNGVAASSGAGVTATWSSSADAVVPHGASYVVSGTGAGCSLSAWLELR